METSINSITIDESLFGEPPTEGFEAKDVKTELEFLVKKAAGEEEVEEAGFQRGQHDLGANHSFSKMGTFNQVETFMENQNSDLLFVKNTCENLRAALNKSHEDRRALELQLVAERALRDQEARNAKTTLENNTIQLNAQISSMRFEAESWKQRTEATNKECHMLKEHLRLAEEEKAVSAKMAMEMREKTNGYENFRKSFELYANRVEETIRDLSKQISDLQTVKEGMTTTLIGVRREIRELNVFVKSQAENNRFLQQQVKSWEKNVLERNRFFQQ